MKKIIVLNLIFASVFLTQGCGLKVSFDQDAGRDICETAETPDLNEGETSQSLANSLDSEGDTHFFAGEYEKASVCYNKALTIREHALGQSDTALIESFYNLATLSEVKENYNEAAQLYKRAKKLLNPQIRTHSSHFRAIQGYLAAIYYQRGSGSTQEELQRGILAYRTIYGQNHIYLGATQHNLANFYLNEKNYKKSETSFKRAMGSIRHNAGSEHPYFAVVLEDYAELLRLTNREPQADQVGKQADSIRTKFPKKQHTKLYQKRSQ